MPQATNIHKVAADGFSNAAAYDAHRPSYPPEAVQRLLKHLELAGKKNARIIDLAAGTGKFTEMLAAREECFNIVAVEPHDEMRRVLGAKGLERVDTRPGTATDMSGIEDGLADAVIVAQAFHWFANEEALNEIRRVLKPDGKLALIWNAENYNKPKAWKAATEWEQKLNELVFLSKNDGQPRFRDYKWMEVLVKQKGLFSTPIGEDKTDWALWLDREGVWARLTTLSHLTVLEGESRDQFKAEVERLMDEGDGTWNEKNEVEIHGATVFFWTTKL